jgi:hypothetical protein
VAISSTAESETFRPLGGEASERGAGWRRKWNGMKVSELEEPEREQWLSESGIAIL